MIRRFWKSEAERNEDKQRLAEIETAVLKEVPGCAISADQAYREADLAVDFCEDVPPLDSKTVDRIVRCFTDRGAQAKISSIHVNGWFGEYNKLEMTRIFFKEQFGEDLEDIKDRVIFTGDSPNDGPMFSYFPNGTGVANINSFIDQMPQEQHPTWVTRQEGGIGFAEMVDHLLG